MMEDDLTKYAKTQSQSSSSLFVPPLLFGSWFIDDKPCQTEVFQRFFSYQIAHALCCKLMQFRVCSLQSGRNKVKECTEVQNGRFSSGGGILSQLQWYQSDIQKLGFPKYEIKDN